jgi:hypothetical protein
MPATALVPLSVTGARVHHAIRTPNRPPSRCATITSSDSATIINTPSADSSTYWPFSHSSQITTDNTSVPGPYSRIELDSSRT